MLKRLFDWLFFTEGERVSEVQVHDFTKRDSGNDITLRMIGDGEYAEAMIFKAMQDPLVHVGDFVVVDMSAPEDIDTDELTFVIETIENVAIGIYKTTLTRYQEGE